MAPYTDFFAKFASEKQHVLIARTSSFKLGGLEFKVKKGKRNTPYAVPIYAGTRKNRCGAIALSTLEVRQDPNERKSDAPRTVVVSAQHVGSGYRDL